MIDTDLTELTAEIVANYVAHNEVAVADVASVIAEVHAALAKLGGEPEAPVETHTPAVSIRKSLADRSKLISMIDGKPYATLRRHLSGHGLTAEDYRARYNLPADYPMTAPAYSQRRSALALAAGLGKRPAEAPATPAPTKSRKKLGISIASKRSDKPA